MKALIITADHFEDCELLVPDLPAFMREILKLLGRVSR